MIYWLLSAISGIASLDQNDSLEIFKSESESGWTSVLVFFCRSRHECFGKFKSRAKYRPQLKNEETKPCATCRTRSGRMSAPWAPQYLWTLTEHRCRPTASIYPGCWARPPRNIAKTVNANFHFPKQNLTKLDTTYCYAHTVLETRSKCWP